MQLREFYDYKEQFMQDILTDEEIVHILNPSIALNDAKSLMYTQVFPYEHLPSTVEEAKTFICCDVDIQKDFNKTFYSPSMFVWVFTHSSKMRLPTGRVTIDELCSLICDHVNGSRFYGLGETGVEYVKRFAPLEDYQGKVMMFSATDFNRVYSPNKPVPARRGIQNRG